MRNSFRKWLNMVCFINIYLKQYAYQCLLKRKPNYTNLKVIQEYDTFFLIIVTCLFCDDYYGCIKSDCSCWTSFSNSTDYKCSGGLHVWSFDTYQSSSSKTNINYSLGRMRLQLKCLMILAHGPNAWVGHIYFYGNCIL